MKSPFAIIREWRSEARSLREEENFHRLYVALLTANEVSFGRIQYGGIITDAARAYHLIFAKPTARADFLQILESGNPAARCYALTGLFYLEEPDFDEIAEPYRYDTTPILSMPGGCVGYELTIGDFIRELFRSRTDDRKAAKLSMRRLP